MASIIEEGNPRQIRMANLSIIGTHSTNGVARLHTDLLKSRLFQVCRYYRSASTVKPAV